MPEVPFSQAPLSPESRDWLISQAKRDRRISHLESKEKEKESKWKINPEDIIKVPRENNQFALYILSKTENVGGGSNSQIYKAYPLSINGEISDPVAVKFIKSAEGDVNDHAAVVEGLDREQTALKTLGKVNDRVTTTEGDFLFMPLYSGKPMVTINGDKLDLTEDFKNIKSITERFDLIFQLGKQVQECHDNNMIHGDLHPNNMLLARSNGALHLQLIDFDQSRSISNKNELISPRTVNMAYPIRAPEVEKNQVGAASDVYALGLNFLFILGHKDPFACAPTKDFIRNLKKDVKENPEKYNFDDVLKEYKESKLSPNTQNEENLKRIVMDQIINDKYIEEKCRFVVLAKHHSSYCEPLS